VGFQLIDPVVAEAQAALHATIFAKDLGLVDIIFEGDAKQIITAINVEHPCLRSYGHLIDGAAAALVGLGNSRFSHVKREANCTAHGLAKLALNCATETTWPDSLPFDIGSIVRKEASFVVL
jgi:ribonuclease HI